MQAKDFKISTSIRINEAVYEKLVTIARDEVRSVNNLMEYALTKFVQNYEANKDSQG